MTSDLVAEAQLPQGLAFQESFAALTSDLLCCDAFNPTVIREK